MPAGVAEAAALAQAIPTSQSDFFGAATILRALILFNLLFAVQTVLDVAYLWATPTTMSATAAKPPARAYGST